MPDNPMPFLANPWVIKPLVPDEVYTDRAEFLEYLSRCHRNRSDGPMVAER